MLDLHQLRVFQAVAQTLSFTEAGKQLFLTQSTVSTHMKQLEEELGCSLFIRRKKRITLSEPGRILLQHVDRLLTEVRKTELAVHEYSTSQRGTIRLGTGATSLIYLLPAVLASYKKKYPLIEIQILTGTSEVLLRGLRDQTLDIAIVMPPSADLALVDSIHLIHEELVIVFPATHSFASKPSLSVEDMQDLRFISHLPHTAMRTVQRHWFDQLGFSPRISIEVENAEAIKTLIALDMGVALLPLCTILSTKDFNLTYKRVSGITMTRELRLASSDWKGQPRPTRRLAAEIKRLIGDESKPQ